MSGLPARWTLRVGALVVAWDGRAPVDVLRQAVAAMGADGVMVDTRRPGSRGSEAARVVKSAVGQLRAADLVERVGDVVAADVPALAAWLAEQHRLRSLA